MKAEALQGSNQCSTKQALDFCHEFEKLVSEVFPNLISKPIFQLEALKNGLEFYNI